MSLVRLAVSSLVVVAVGCSGVNGLDGQDGKPCSVTALDGGAARILCADGTSTVVLPGQPGQPGQPGAPGDAGTSCTVRDLDAGVKLISCTDGTSVTVVNGSNGTNGTNGSNGTNGTNGTNGSNGANGNNGSAAIGNFHGTDLLAANALASSGKFMAGITFTAASADPSGKVTVNFQVTQPLPDGGALPVNGLPTPRFTIAKLVPPALGESSNHWVPYITRIATVPADAGGYVNPPGTRVLQAYRENGGTFTALGDGGYQYVYFTNLSTVGFANDAGLVGYDRTLTHRVAVLMGGASGPTGSAYFDFVPSGSAVTETRDIISTDLSCRQCHGPTFAAHGGDRTEVGVCVTCHNSTSTDAYTNNTVDFKVMVHRIHAGSEVPSVAGPDGQVWDNPATPGVDESADNKPYTIGPRDNGWWKIEFPSVLSNCTKCHTGTQANADNWKTKPGIAACTSCHDDLDLAGGTNHPGSVQTDDRFCAGCHIASGTETSVLKPVETMHDWQSRDTRLNQEFNIAVSMTPPGNGQFYVKGEAPVVRIELTDVETGLPIDHSQFLPDPAAEGCPLDGGTTTCGPRDGLFTVSSLLVHGPRSLQNPVLTTHARAAVLSSGLGPFDLSADGGTLALKVDNGTDVPIHVNGADLFLKGAITVPVAGGVFASKAAATVAEVVTWLNANAAFAGRAIAYVDATGKVGVRSRNLAPVYAMQLQASSVAAAVFGNDLTVHVPGGFTPTNTLAMLADGGVNDPKVGYSPGALTYQLDPVDDLTPGTYTVQLEIADRGRVDINNFKVPSVKMFNFQVGQAAVEKPIANNCSLCHQSNGKGQLFDPSRHNKILSSSATDQCTGCHDYQPQAATGAWSGAVPISRRVHAVHNGSALTYPNTTVGHADEIPARNWDIEFPQDIRNCETCHQKGTTSGSWKTNPNRIACGGCHDTDAASAHIKLMTVDPTPADPYSGDEQEACKVCH